VNSTEKRLAEALRENQALRAGRNTAFVASMVLFVILVLTLLVGCASTSPSPEEIGERQVNRAIRTVEGAVWRKVGEMTR
jgi:hypothetical protein